MKRLTAVLWLFFVTASVFAQERSSLAKPPTITEKVSGMQKFAGYVVQWTGSYSILFMISASAYLVALLVIHLCAPKLSQAELD